MSNNKHTLLIVIITAFIFTNFGFFTNYYLMNPNQLKPTNNCNFQNSDNSFVLGWKAAEDRMITAGYLIPEMRDEEYKSINGEILKIENGNFILTINPYYPLSDPDFDIRKVFINTDTKFFISRLKDEDSYNKEINEYEKKISEINILEQENQESLSTSTPITYPEFPDMYAKIESDLFSLQEGMYLEVYSNLPLNNKKEFTATEIIFEEIQ